MKPNGTIEVEYPGGNLRDAKVIHVFESADLVLLETNIDAKPVDNNVVALSGYAGGKPDFGDKIYALGYNGGSLGIRHKCSKKDMPTRKHWNFLCGIKTKPAWRLSDFRRWKFQSTSSAASFTGILWFSDIQHPEWTHRDRWRRTWAGQMNVKLVHPGLQSWKLETSPPALPARAWVECIVLYSAEDVDRRNSDDPQQKHEAATQQLVKNTKSYFYGDFNFLPDRPERWRRWWIPHWHEEPGRDVAEEFENRRFLLITTDFDFDNLWGCQQRICSLPFRVEQLWCTDTDLKLFQVDLCSTRWRILHLFYGMETHNGDPVKGNFCRICHQAFGDTTQGLTQTLNIPGRSGFKRGVAEWFF